MSFKNPPGVVSATATFAVLGFVSGELTAGAFGLLKNIPLQGVFANVLTPFVFCFWPGISFGTVVMVPWSRELGRRWLTSLLSIPVAVLAYWCAGVTFLMWVPLLNIGAPGSGNKAHPLLGGLLAGIIGSMVVGMWMSSRRSASSSIAVALASSLSGLACGAYFSMSDGAWEGYMPGVYNGFAAWVWFGLPFVLFQTLTAAGLSVQLWWANGTTLKEAHRELTA